MDCLHAREAMSAQMDGELPEVADALVQAHVQRCEACRAWREAAFDVTRRVRMTGWTAPAQPASLTQVILTAVTPRNRRVSAPRVRAVLLAAAAIGQLVLTVPLLADAASPGMHLDMHETHELGVFDFALAVAFLIGAIRPRLASGLAWPCVAAAVGLLGTSMIDVVTHHTFESHELRHLIAVTGALLLCWAARDERRPELGGVGLKAAAPSGQLAALVADWHSAGAQSSAGDAHSDSRPAAASAGGGAA